MSKLNCDVTKDLLPLYVDKICSEESARLVDEHLAECEECARVKRQMEDDMIAKRVRREELAFVHAVKTKRQKRHMVYTGIILLAITVSILLALIEKYNLISYPLHFILMPATIFALCFLTGDKSAKGNYKFHIAGHVINIFCIVCMFFCIFQVLDASVPVSRVKKLSLAYIDGRIEAIVLLLLMLMSSLTEYISLLLVIRASSKNFRSYPGFLCETVTGIYILWVFISVMYEMQFQNILRNVIAVSVLVLPVEGIATYFVIKGIQKKRDNRQEELV